MLPPLPDLPGVTHSHVQAGDVRLHVAEAGEGEPVVLLHGWPQHWYVWRKVIPLLSGRFRIIAPDLRGFGWSDAPRSSYRKEELAGDVVALLDALDLERVRLAGHDWGGFVGFLACLRAPERISSYTGMAIVHPWAKLPLTLKGLVTASYQLVLAAPAVGALVQRHTPFVEGIMRAGGDIWTPEERRIFADAFRDPDHAEAASRVYRSFLATERAAIDGGAYDDSRLTVPTRLLVGRQDPVVTAERVAGWEGHADDMLLEQVDAGHWLPEEVPDLVAERIGGPI